MKLPATGSGGPRRGGRERVAGSAGEPAWWSFCARTMPPRRDGFTSRSRRHPACLPERRKPTGHGACRRIGRTRRRPRIRRSRAGPRRPARSRALFHRLDRARLSAPFTDGRRGRARSLARHSGPVGG